MKETLQLIKSIVGSDRGTTEVSKEIYNLLVHEKTLMLEDIKKKMCTLDSEVYADVSYKKNYKPGSFRHAAFVDGEMEIYNMVDGFLFKEIETLKTKWVR